MIGFFQDVNLSQKESLDKGKDSVSDVTLI